MNTQQFLDYLNEHTESRDLAAEVAELLASRRLRRERAAATVATPTPTPTQISARVAS
jgi:hypothetical protein